MRESLLRDVPSAGIDDDLLAGFASTCTSCAGPVEPLMRARATWWQCHRCGLARVA